MNTTRKCFAAGVLLLCASLPAVAVAEIERSFPARADGEVRVRNLAGSVVVEAWDRAEVQLLARLGPGQELEVDEREGLIVIEVHAQGRRAGSAELELRVPAASRLQLAAVSADLTVAGVHGPLDLHTVSGAIASDGFGADLRARTVSGDLRLEGSERPGRVEVTTVNGRVQLAGAAGALEVSTVDGPVRIDGGRFERVRLNSVSADLRGQLALADDGVFDADSVSGRIAVRLPDALGARFDLQAITGSIRDCNGHRAEPQSRFGPGRRLTFTRAEGGATVRARTMSGEIDLCGR